MLPEIVSDFQQNRSSLFSGTFFRNKENWNFCFRSLSKIGDNKLAVVVAVAVAVAVVQKLKTLNDYCST